MESHTSPKAVEHESFAHELADALHQGLVEHSYQNLVLVAGPQFLGRLRNVLDDQVQKHVTASLDKDYTQLTAPEIEKHLTEQIDGFFLVANRASA
jgi:protein required for attachment to host cells